MRKFLGFFSFHSLFLFQVSIRLQTEKLELTTLFFMTPIEVRSRRFYSGPS